jgi:heme/copper-type cytochrome/quinol oxidase subunit 3
MYSPIFPFIHGKCRLAYVGLMTFILIMSSVTMVLAVDAGHRRVKKNVLMWLGLTIIGGSYVRRFPGLGMVSFYRRISTGRSA